MMVASTDVRNAKRRTLWVNSLVVGFELALKDRQGAIGEGNQDGGKVNKRTSSKQKAQHPTIVFRGQWVC